VDMDDLTPAGAGSLRDRTHRVGRQTVATFTPPRTVHPDEIWNPRGAEITGHRPWRSASKAHHQEPKHAEHTPHQETARMVRAALRPEG
jgi:hypothetical protein